MSSLTIEIIGYLALFINLFSMAVKGEKKLRVISAIANSLLIVYGILLSATPIVIGSFIAVCLHLYHIHRLVKERNLQV